jgi:hypothetical protein
MLGHWVRSQCAKVPRRARLGDVLPFQRGKSNAPLYGTMYAGKRWADPNSSTVQRGLMALRHHDFFRVQVCCAACPRQYSPHPVCLPPISADQHRSGWGDCVCVLHCCCEDCDNINP